MPPTTPSPLTAVVQPSTFMSPLQSAEEAEEDVQRRCIRSWSHFDELRNEICVVVLHACYRLLREDDVLQQEQQLDVAGDTSNVSPGSSPTLGHPSIPSNSSGNRSGALYVQRAYEWSLWLLPAHGYNGESNHGHLPSVGLPLGATALPLNEAELRGWRESSLAKQYIREHVHVDTGTDDAKQPLQQHIQKEEGSSGSAVACSGKFTVASAPLPLPDTADGAAAPNASFFTALSSTEGRNEAHSQVAHPSATTPVSSTFSGTDSVDLLKENASLSAGLMGVEFLSSREVLVYTATGGSEVEPDSIQGITLDLFLIASPVYPCRAATTPLPCGLQWHRVPGFLTLPVPCAAAPLPSASQTSRPHPTAHSTSPVLPSRLLHFSLSFSSPETVAPLNLFYATATPSHASLGRSFDVGAAVLEVHHVDTAVQSYRDECAELARRAAEGEEEEMEKQHHRLQALMPAIIKVKLVQDFVDTNRDFSRLWLPIKHTTSASRSPRTAVDCQGGFILPWECLWVLQPLGDSSEARLVALLPVPTTDSVPEMEGTPSTSSVVAPHHLSSAPVQLLGYDCVEEELVSEASRSKHSRPTRWRAALGLSLPLNCGWKAATAPLRAESEAPETLLSHLLGESRRRVYVTSHTALPSSSAPASPFNWYRVPESSKDLHGSSSESVSCESKHFPVMLHLALGFSPLSGAAAPLSTPAGSSRSCGLYVSGLSWGHLRESARPALHPRIGATTRSQLEETDGEHPEHWAWSVPNEEGNNVWWCGTTPIRLPEDSVVHPGALTLEKGGSAAGGRSGWSSPPFQHMASAPRPVIRRLPPHSRHSAGAALPCPSPAFERLLSRFRTGICLQNRPVTGEFRVLRITTATIASADSSTARWLTDLTVTPPPLAPPPLVHHVVPTRAEGHTLSHSALPRIASSPSTEDEMTSLQRMAEWIAAVVWEAFEPEESAELTVHSPQPTSCESVRRATSLDLIPSLIEVASGAEEVVPSGKAVGPSSGPAHAESPVAWMAASIMVHALWHRILDSSDSVHTLLGPLFRTFQEGRHCHTAEGVRSEGRRNAPTPPTCANELSLTHLAHALLFVPEEEDMIATLSGEDLAASMLRRCLQQFYYGHHSSTKPISRGTRPASPTCPPPEAECATPEDCEARLLQLALRWRRAMDHLLLTLDWQSTSVFGAKVLRAVALLFFGASIPEEVHLFVAQQTGVTRPAAGSAAADSSPSTCSHFAASAVSVDGATTCPKRFWRCLQQFTMISTEDSSSADEATPTWRHTNGGSEGPLEHLILTPVESVVSRFLLQVAAAYKGETHAACAACHEQQLYCAGKESASTVGYEWGPTPAALLLLYVHRGLHIPLELMLEDFWPTPSCSTPDPCEPTEEEFDEEELSVAQRRSIGHVLLEVVNPNWLWQSAQRLLSPPKEESRVKASSDVAPLATCWRSSCAVALTQVAARNLWRLLGQWQPDTYLTFSLNNIGLALPAFVVECLCAFAGMRPSSGMVRSRSSAGGATRTREESGVEEWQAALDLVWHHWAVQTSDEENPAKRHEHAERVLTSLLAPILQQGGGLPLSDSPLLCFFPGGDHHGVPSRSRSFSFHLLAALHVLQRLLQSVERAHLWSQVLRLSPSAAAAGHTHDRSESVESDEDWLSRMPQSTPASDGTGDKSPKTDGNAEEDHSSACMRWLEAHQAELLLLYRGVATLRWLCTENVSCADALRDALLVVAEEEWHRRMPFGLAVGTETEAVKAHPPAGSARNSSFTVLRLQLASFAALFPALREPVAETDGDDLLTVATAQAQRAAQLTEVLPPLYQVLHLALASSSSPVGQRLLRRMIWVMGRQGQDQVSPLYRNATVPSPLLPLASHSPVPKAASHYDGAEVCMIVLLLLDAEATQHSHKPLIEADERKPRKVASRSSTGPVVCASVLLVPFWTHVWEEMFRYQPDACVNTRLIAHIREFVLGELQAPAVPPLTRGRYTVSLLSLVCDAVLLPFYLHAFPVLLSVASMIEERNHTSAGEEGATGSPSRSDSPRHGRKAQRSNSVSRSSHGTQSAGFSSTLLPVLLTVQRGADDSSVLLRQYELVSSARRTAAGAALVEEHYMLPGEALSKFQAELYKILEAVGKLQDRCSLLLHEQGTPLVERRLILRYEAIAKTLLALTRLMPSDPVVVAASSPTVAMHARTTSISFPLTPSHRRMPSGAGRATIPDVAAQHWGDSYTSSPALSMVGMEHGEEGRELHDFFFPPPHAYFLATQLFTEETAKLLVAGELVRRQLHEYVVSHLLHEELLLSVGDPNSTTPVGWVTAMDMSTLSASISVTPSSEAYGSLQCGELPESMAPWSVKDYLNDCFEKMEHCGHIFSRAKEVLEKEQCGALSANKDNEDDEDAQTHSLAACYGTMQVLLLMDVQHALFLQKAPPSAAVSSTTSGRRLTASYWENIGTVWIPAVTRDEMLQCVRKVAYQHYTMLSLDQQQLLRVLLRAEFMPYAYTEPNKPLSLQHQPATTTAGEAVAVGRSEEYCSVPTPQKSSRSNTPLSTPQRESSSGPLGKRLSTHVVGGSETEPRTEAFDGVEVGTAASTARSPPRGRAAPLPLLSPSSSREVATHLLGDVARLSAMQQLRREEAAQRQRLYQTFAEEWRTLWRTGVEAPMVQCWLELQVCRRYSSPHALAEIYRYAAEQKDIVFVYEMRAMTAWRARFKTELRAMFIRSIEAWQRQLREIPQREMENREAIEMTWRRSWEACRHDARLTFDLLWEEHQARERVEQEWREVVEDVLYTELEAIGEIEEEMATSPIMVEALLWREALHRMIDRWKQQRPVLQSTPRLLAGTVPSPSAGRSERATSTPERAPIVVAELVELEPVVEAGSAAFAKIGGSVFGVVKSIRNKFVDTSSTAVAPAPTTRAPEAGKERHLPSVKEELQTAVRQWHLEHSPAPQHDEEKPEDKEVWRDDDFDTEDNEAAWGEGVKMTTGRTLPSNKSALKPKQRTEAMHEATPPMPLTSSPVSQLSHSKPPQCSGQRSDGLQQPTTVISLSHPVMPPHHLQDTDVCSLSPGSTSAAPPKALKKKKGLGAKAVARVSGLPPASVGDAPSNVLPAPVRVPPPVLSPTDEKPPLEPVPCRPLPQPAPTTPSPLVVVETAAPKLPPVEVEAAVKGVVALKPVRSRAAAAEAVAPRKIKKGLGATRLGGTVMPPMGNPVVSSDDLPGVENDIDDDVGFVRQPTPLSGLEGNVVRKKLGVPPLALPTSPLPSPREPASGRCPNVDDSETVKQEPPPPQQEEEEEEEERALVAFVRDLTSVSAPESHPHTDLPEPSTAMETEMRMTTSLPGAAAETEVPVPSQEAGPAILESSRPSPTPPSESDAAVVRAKEEALPVDVENRLFYVLVRYLRQIESESERRACATELGDCVETEERHRLRLTYWQQMEWCRLYRDIMNYCQTDSGGPYKGIDTSPLCS